MQTDTKYVTTQIADATHRELRIHSIRVRRDVREIVTEAVAAYLASAGAERGGAR